MQEIWQTKTTWDENLTISIAKKWEKMRSQLHLLSDLRIPRWLKSEKNDRIELIGFSDASLKAYAAVIYMRVWKNGVPNISLVTSKTRVAPIIKLTLPKLELSAALLLARLMATVKRALNVQIDKTFYFSDSEVTLAWIRGESNRWKIFVANRVKEICQLSDKNDWRYVPSKENSADCASRGLLPEQLF